MTIISDKQAAIFPVNQSDLRSYLDLQYRGIFDEAGIESHIRDYVGFTFADQVVPLVAMDVPPGGRVLDIGAGFGAFVIAARKAGLKAIGLEIAFFEVLYASQRLQGESLGLTNGNIFMQGNGLSLPFEQDSFDAVTLWNIMEHINSGEKLLREVSRILKPDGHLYIICPNYCAFRQEAHYHIFWPSLIPRGIGRLYLKMRGKDSRFFENNIFYRTNWEVLNTLKNIGFTVTPLGAKPVKPPQVSIDPAFRLKLSDPQYTQNKYKRFVLFIIKAARLNHLALYLLTLFSRIKLFRAYIYYLKYLFRLYNPFIDSIVLHARKWNNP